MRYTNLYTGENIMTEQNALRHYISKAVKVKKHGNFEEMHKIYNDAHKELNINLCRKCIMDDIGYCALRRSHISFQDKFIKYCFQSFIDGMIAELNERQHTKSKEQH